MILCSGNRASAFMGCCVLWVLKMQFSWTLPSGGQGCVFGVPQEPAWWGPIGGPHILWTVPLEAHMDSFS